ncbi:hypothetical protein [Acinetobacter phage P577]|uniref:hypothetical protein n=1 Tax=Acinetobacter phage YMC13/03/R2096 TaxID=1560342 RepID=UPI00052AA3F1|nr:hypothetical protein ACQ36_gp028 [Acinetobacter phage YMC13/03/R2096]AIW02762.1 hypothetical protein BPABA577_00280 [Acinetobacter phage YMC13/03/R2096]WNT46253.1 hypothetical protein [Acinetobacter phage P577]
MKITTNDKRGIGKEKGVFVYTFLDSDGDANGLRIVISDDFKPNFLCEQDLISVQEDNSINFYDTRRNMLDEVSCQKVGILSKSELDQLITSLISAYNLMEDDNV